MKVPYILFIRQVIDLFEVFLCKKTQTRSLVRAGGDNPGGKYGGINSSGQPFITALITE